MHWKRKQAIDFLKASFTAVRGSCAELKMVTADETGPREMSEEAHAILLNATPDNEEELDKEFELSIDEDTVIKLRTAFGHAAKKQNPYFASRWANKKQRLWDFSRSRTLHLQVERKGELCLEAQARFYADGKDRPAYIEFEKGDRDVLAEVAAQVDALQAA